MIKKIVKFLVLITAVIACTSCSQKSVDSIEYFDAAECTNAIKKTPAEMPQLDPELAGKEHNLVLSYLVEKFDSEENPTFDEIFDAWIDYSQRRLSEFGGPKFTEEDINMFYKSLCQLYSLCNTQFVGDAVFSYIKYMDEYGLISKDFTEYCLNCFSDMDFEKNDPNQIKESMSKRLTYLNKRDEILAQNMMGVAEYSIVYWKEYFATKDSKKDDGSDKKDKDSKDEDKEKKEIKRRNENIREFCATSVDVLTAAGAATTGVGAIASGLVGGVGTFLIKEAMGW